MNDHFAEKLFSQNDWAAMRLFVQNHPEMDINWKPDLEREGRFTAGINWYRANVARRMQSLNNFAPNKIEIPVMGIHSDGDWYLSQKQMINSKNYVKDWSFQSVKECSHWIPLDKPEELSKIILDYYKTLN